MTTATSVSEHVSTVRRRTLALVWGDRTGLLVFLASLCLFGLFWRTTFLINDSYTLANGLYALEQGSLHMTEAVYGPTLESPGANFYDGQTFSRNYGMLVVALPVLLALRAAELVGDLRIVLVAGWSLLLLATVLLAGRILDQRRYARLGGSAAVLALFAGNVALATPLDPPQHHLLALQIVHMVAAAFVGVFTYRLVGALHERRRALLATVIVTLGTPLAFWASVPKRHVLTAAIVLGVAFAIVRSRDGDRKHATTARALGYVMTGFLAWVHAPEALILLLVLVAVDVPTAPSNDPRTLAVVGGAFLVSLLPMVITNLAITGNPLKVPRALRSVSAGADVSLAGGDSTGDSTGGGAGATWLPGFALVALALVESAVQPLQILSDRLLDGARNVVTEPAQVYEVFVRSGYLARVAERATDDPATNLSVVESAPIVAALAASLGVVARAVRAPLDVASVRRHVSPADVFLVLAGVSYTLLYVSSLPIHAQVTVRYLFPVFPIAVVLLVRLPPVGTTITAHWRTFLWTYAAAVLVGGQLLLVTLVVLDPGRGEAFQFHALLALGTAGLVALWSLTGRTDDWWGRVGAATMALATAAATTFLLFVVLDYYALNDTHLLPMMRVLAERLTIV